MNKSFWNGKTVFLTGHTGFKGSWLSIWLHKLGATVHGYALEAPTNPNLYEVAGVGDFVNSTIGDIRDLGSLKKAYDSCNPDIAIHMAAQPIVRDSYLEPVYTYETNVMGTVNFLEVIRQNPVCEAGLIVTSDKCYENKEWVWGYREDEAMGGYDPYSNSKGCSELVTSSYRQSFFTGKDGPQIASARAGNVIGGGDWASSRLIPDFFRAIEANRKLMIRYPNSVRPWQHVLVPLSGYLRICEELSLRSDIAAEGWNFGPDNEKDYSVENVLEVFKKIWPDKVDWEVEAGPKPHEAMNLRLDSSKARRHLSWRPFWSCEQGIIATAEWQQAYFTGQNMQEVTLNQIADYEGR